MKNVNLILLKHNQVTNLNLILLKRNQVTTFSLLNSQRVLLTNLLSSASEKPIFSYELSLPKTKGTATIYLGTFQTALQKPEELIQHYNIRSVLTLIDFPDQLAPHLIPLQKLYSQEGKLCKGSTVIHSGLRSQR